MAAVDKPDPIALAAIRPGDPKDKLAGVIGRRWREPRPDEAGKVDYLKEDFHFSARLDRDGKVGSVRFEFNFPPHVTIEGVHLLMPEAEIARAAPKIELGKPTENFPYRIGHLELPDGAGFGIEVGHGRITRIWISNPQAVYPDAASSPLPLPTSTFNVGVVSGLQPRGTPAPDGWCCGLPRGITPIQWPLSNKNGFPLEHHFTVRVPQAYRVKGPQYVALALFSETTYESDKAPAVHDLMDIIFDGRQLPDTVAPELQPFLDHLRHRHPMDFRSKDILDQTFAMIWLTEEEFQGAECEPLVPTVTAANADCERPHWLTFSSVQQIFGWNGGEEFTGESFLQRLVGRKPSGPWDLLLLKQTERHDDPNVGKRPVETYGLEEYADRNKDGYVEKHSEAWGALGIEITYGELHFGGTASPCQAMPALTPFFIEFEESMGLLNFGGGNGQLDLISMQIDWAQ